MSNKLLIYNGRTFHWEVLESVLKNRDMIFKNLPDVLEIHMFVEENPSFLQYMRQKYPHIQVEANPKFQSKLDFHHFLQKYDFVIHCTLYDSQYRNIQRDSRNAYIAHDVTKRLQEYPNVFFLCPFSSTNVLTATVLPYTDALRPHPRTPIPIYVVQGNLRKRDLSSLYSILQNTKQLTYKIKILCKKVSDSIRQRLRPYKDKVILCENYNFEEYHREFLNCYCIMTLLPLHASSEYYHNKLTSSINYAKAYHLKCFLDDKLQSIYQLPDVFVYDQKNIINVFIGSIQRYRL